MTYPLKYKVFDKLPPPSILCKTFHQKWKPKYFLLYGNFLLSQ